MENPLKVSISSRSELIHHPSESSVLSRLFDWKDKETQALTWRSRMKLKSAAVFSVLQDGEREEHGLHCRIFTCIIIFSLCKSIAWKRQVAKLLIALLLVMGSHLTSDTRRMTRPHEEASWFSSDPKNPLVEEVGVKILWKAQEEVEGVKRPCKIQEGVVEVEGLKRPCKIQAEVGRDEGEEVRMVEVVAQSMGEEKEEGVEAVVGNGIPSVGAKGFWPLRWRYHLLRSGNFTLGCQYSNLSASHLLLAQGHRLNKRHSETIDCLKTDTIQSAHSGCEAAHHHASDVKKSQGRLVAHIEVFVLAVVGHPEQIALVLQKSFPGAWSLLKDFLDLLPAWAQVVFSHRAHLQC
ncbi:hypothetical protein DNTS_013445 [Danionella cerebrum]|uniref:Uncharacterized protein n=1 Tax=Danionella cerebrum TaxID=2873325 RepID=A0A553N3C4_9TELE|nr:hypothetical protein DNTS_013445 [Danionella translucida]